MKLIRRRKMTMRKSFYPFTLLVLGAGLALAQTTSPQNPSGAPTTAPTMAEQRTPSTVPPDTPGQQPDQPEPVDPAQTAAATLLTTEASPAPPAGSEPRLQARIHQS